MLTDVQVAKKRREQVDASEALMEWFKSQNIDSADACQVMCILLAGIIGSFSGGSRKRQIAGADLVKKDILLTLGDGF